MENIENWWSSFYGSATPVPYILREEIPDRWVRIHSLPESKRYAETPEEYSMLLARHNEIAKEVLGENSHCFLFVAQYAESLESPLHVPEEFGFETMQFHLFGIIEALYPDLWRVWAAKVHWESGRFDELIEAVANDEVRYISFASIETREIYAPYDGGADLFLRSTGRRNALKQNYAKWLSLHPEGL